MIDYDFIGDIHGHAEELKALLNKMGYKKAKGAQSEYYAHPERKVVFVGDYIDRGPKIKETLELVKAMVENDQAIALMGNHEYNAICYNTKNSSGQYLRPHTAKNKKQHEATLDQFSDDIESYEQYIEWFKTLPLYYETDDWRAVHACWDEQIIAKLKHKLINDRLTDDLIIKSADQQTALYNWIEITLKGKELPLPDGVSFDDKDGHPRKDVRIKWWIKPIGKTYQDLRVNLEYDVPIEPVDDTHELFDAVYPENAKPVFFGHYWLRGKPALQTKNVCCLDYSVAKKGKLVAYRLQDEDELNEVNLYY